MNQSEPLTDKILVAFADGQLSAKEMENIRELIQKDTVSQEKVERYKESEQMLKDLLGGNLNDRRPQHIAQKIRSLRPKLMVNEADDPEMDNVIIFPSFATRMSKSVAETFSVKNLNKIAAGVVLSGIIGVGGTLYYSKVPEKDRMVVVTLDSPPNKFVFRGAKEPPTNGNEPNHAHTLFLHVGNKTIAPGSTITGMDIYRLSLTAEKPGLLKMEYIEGSDPLVSLVTKKLVAKGDKINYP